MREYTYFEPKALQDIENLNRKDTEILWRQYFRATIPKGLSIALAKPILAHEFQVRHLGGLDRKTRAVLRQAGKNVNRPRSAKFKSGTQLIREWNGVVHKVEVIDEGFLYDGNRYKSLTAIAETITGAHWSGPRFFGTTKPKVVYGKS